MIPPPSHRNNTYPTCRICLSSDEPKSLIAPCKCKGTVKYVHKTCLMQWRKRLVSNGGPQELDTCTLCKFRYIIRRNSKFGNLITQPGVQFIITCIIILIILLPSGYMMKLIMTKLYLRGNGINGTTTSLSWTSYHLPFCSTLTKSTFETDYYSLILDKDFWFKIMCNDIVQHLHLGLFFLGSASNIVTTYYLINELLDQNLDQLQPLQGNRIKKFILWGSFGLIIGFWFHYTLSAFKVATTQEFLQELPLWILRWMTVGMAVFEFGLRRIFRQLHIMVNADDWEVLSIQKMDFNEI